MIMYSPGKVDAENGILIVVMLLTQGVDACRLDLDAADLFAWVCDRRICRIVTLVSLAHSVHQLDIPPALRIFHTKLRGIYRYRYADGRSKSLLASSRG